MITARPRGHAVLRSVSPAPLEREYLIDETMVIGRDAALADIVVSGAAVSRTHCRLRPGEQGHWWIDDLESTNGVFIDGVRAEQAVALKTGQAIALGNAAVPDFIFYPGTEIGKSRDRVIGVRAVDHRSINGRRCCLAGRWRG